MSLGSRDAPAEENLCSEERWEHCCCQTVLEPGGARCFCVWLRDLYFTPFESCFEFSCEPQTSAKPGRVRKTKSTCKVRFFFQPVPRQALTQKSLGVWKGQLLKLDSDLTVCLCQVQNKKRPWGFTLWCLPFCCSGVCIYSKDAGGPQGILGALLKMIRSP